MPEVASTLKGWNPASVLSSRSLPVQFKREQGSKENVKTTGELEALSADLTRASDMTALASSRAISDGFFHWVEDQLHKVDVFDAVEVIDHTEVDTRDVIHRMIQDERIGAEFIDGPRILLYERAKREALESAKRK
jgi:hypothetical protein